MKRLIILLALASPVAAEEEEKIDLHIEIKLLSIADRPSRHMHLLCEVDGTYFMIPRSMIERGKQFIIAAPNGIKFALPWQKGQCREMEVFW